MFFFYHEIKSFIVPQAPHTQEKKITLNLQQIITPAPKPKPMVKPVITPPQPKKTVEKKVEKVKRVLLDQSIKTYAIKRHKENNISKAKPKAVKKEIKKKPKKKKIVKKKVIKKKRIKKKRIVKHKPKRTKRSKDPLANMLMGAGTALYPSRPTRHSSPTQLHINKLYGKAFKSYTPTQKKFIRQNLNRIQQITQRTLVQNGYPEVAIQTKQQGTNIVSFYLHPNGDITGLKLKRALGYAALDKNTLHVIRIAYKNYPLPKQKTRLIFYVRYSIY
jgi:TonB family protein